MEREMFYGAKPIIFERAKYLRENMTDTEKILWNELKLNKIDGYRFKAQHPIDIYVVDFYCHKAKLVIEIDGKMHEFQKNEDISRADEIKSFGLKVIRFSNNDIRKNLTNVIEKIRKEVLLSF
jgi:very-short-patch-repair endonuclease